MTPKIEKPSLLKETNVRYSANAASTAVNPGATLPGAVAQPASAEWVELGGEAWMALHLLDRLNVDTEDDLRVQQVEEIVRRMGTALSAVTAERDRLQKNLSFTEQWYAERFERLADLGESVGCWDAMAAIIANGTADQYEPPTYAQQLVKANHRADVAEQERDQLRADVEALQPDADRYRWLTDDHESREQRAARNDLCARLPVMSYSAASAAIDAAMAAKEGL